MRPLPIEVRDGLAYEEFVRDYLLLHRPVYIKNAFPQWKALGKWTPEFLRRTYGDRSVTVSGKETSLGAYLDRVEASTPDNPVPYLRELSVRKLAPELGEELLPFVAYALPNCGEPSEQPSPRSGSPDGRPFPAVLNLRAWSPAERRRSVGSTGMRPAAPSSRRSPSPCPPLPSWPRSRRIWSA